MKRATLFAITCSLLLFSLPLFAQAPQVVNTSIASITNGDLSYFTDAVFTPDAKWVIAAASDNNICVYNNSGQLQTVFPAHNKPIRKIALTNDGNLLTVSEDKSIKLWTPAGNLLNTVNAHGKAINSITVSHNGKYWVTTSDDKTAKIWNCNGVLVQTLKDHDDVVNAAAFSPDDNFILTASKDNTLKVWTINGEMLRTFVKFNASIQSVQYSSDGRQILVSAGNFAYLLSQSGKQLSVFSGHEKLVNSAVFSPDCNFVLTASDDNTIKLWNLNGTLVCTYMGHKGGVNGAVFSATGQYILSNSLDNTAKIWAVQAPADIAESAAAPAQTIYAVPVGNPGGNAATRNSAQQPPTKEKYTEDTDNQYKGPIFSSYDVSALDKAANKPKVWAVVVGIAGYNHVQSLKFTKDDAYLMYAFLKSPEGGALPDEQISLLIDGNATKNQILQALQKTSSSAGLNDAILFYFAGHGINTGLLPIDYDGFNNVLPYGEIYGYFQKSKAKYKLCITDACYAGNFSEYASRSSEDVKNMLEKYYGAIDNASGGTAILMSSKAQEKSVEYYGLRQGVFSHFLMRGLKGEADTDKDKLITIVELFDFVETNVRSYTANAQSPSLFGNFDVRMPVGGVR
ncbi:hypothetical protein C7N43_01900 [Sphingobacteriales bacterium UPWRP_1]|nr:hypothetical protein B6N25_15245 [Sphingobacteriales bacterium TSM_CSS]PSJ78779.1 hypothetical protein C7N43_01900 [Sphingobacteriales bacterium UPWRP_1]